MVHNEKHRLGVTTNVAWYFYVQAGLWDPDIWLHDYDTLHLLIGHREDIDPRYSECQDFDDENVRWLDMTVAMMFRYTWYGSMEPISNGTIIDMDMVNRIWIESKGDHQRLKHASYILENS